MGEVRMRLYSQTQCKERANTVYLLCTVTYTVLLDGLAPQTHTHKNPEEEIKGKRDRVVDPRARVLLDPTQRGDSHTILSDSATTTDPLKVPSIQRAQSDPASTVQRASLEP